MADVIKIITKNRRFPNKKEEITYVICNKSLLIIFRLIKITDYVKKSDDNLYYLLLLGIGLLKTV